jgi:hypothetical protein
MKQFHDNPRALPALVRYECGCIGFAANLEGDALILVHCDGDSFDAAYPVIRPMRRRDRLKTFEAISLGDTAEIWSRIAGLLSDGERFRALKELLE